MTRTVVSRGHAHNARAECMSEPSPPLHPAWRAHGLQQAIERAYGGTQILRSDWPAMFEAQVQVAWKLWQPHFYEHIKRE